MGENMICLMGVREVWTNVQYAISLPISFGKTINIETSSRFQFEILIQIK